MKKTMLCRITKIREAVNGIFDLSFYAPEMAKEAAPGQFVHIKTGAGLLRRPISICDVTENEIRIIFAVRGEGTMALSTKKVGDEIDVLGPLGNGFTPCGEAPAVIGGGIGVFPLLYLCRQLKNPKIYLGFRSSEQMLLIEEFEKLGEVHVATDDGSFGHHGLVTDLVEKPDVYFACGPEPMLRAVQKIAGDTPSQLSMEARMGCGIGACAVCTCKAGGHYEKVCEKGPVFDGKELEFHD